MRLLNRPDMIDTALLRPGRFDRIVFVPNPDRRTRKRILEIYATDKPIGADVDLEKIADITDGFSGADACCHCEYSYIPCATRISGEVPDTGRSGKACIRSIRNDASL